MLSKCKTIPLAQLLKTKTFETDAAPLQTWRNDFFLLKGFQDFNRTLKRDKIILMQREQFLLDSLTKLLGTKVHKLSLLVTQLELLFGAAVRLVHSVSISACSHSSITQNQLQGK